MAHLAAAFARPAVTLAGPVPPRRWGPPPRPWHRVLWAGLEGDPHAAQPGPGLLALQPGEVITAAAELLDTAGARCLDILAGGSDRADKASHGS
jgi:ADP-heptose:LPS heptosyltransferase